MLFINLVGQSQFSTDTPVPLADSAETVTAHQNARSSGGESILSQPALVPFQQSVVGVCSLMAHLVSRTGEQTE